VDSAVSAAVSTRNRDVAVNKNKIIAQAQKFTAKGQFEKAIGEYQKLLKLDPNDIRTWLKMGDLYTRMGARKEATETYLRVADHYKKSGFHLKAVAVYKQVLKLDPTLIDVYELLGDAYLSLGLTSEALIQLEQLADMLQRMELPDRMLRVLLRMAEIDPGNIATRLRIAEHLSKEEKAEDAVEQFGIACNQLRQQGRIDDFLKVAERLLYHDPSRVEVAREASSFYMEQGQYKRALGKLQVCFAKDPRDLATLELLAEAFIGLKQPEKAVSVYNEMAHILGDQNQEQERVEVLHRVLALDPQNEIALKALGQTREPELKSEEVELPSPAAAAAGDVPQVEQPTATEPVSDLSELSDEEAASRAEKILSETEVLLKYGLKDRASDHLKKILEFDYYNLDAREKLAELQLDGGDTPGALEHLFVLAEGFREEQPEGAVYYLHKILRIDNANARAREFLGEIGGVLPDGLEEEVGEPLEIAPDFDDIGVAEDEEPAPAIAEPELDEPEEPMLVEADDDELVLGDGHPETSDILDLSDDQIVADEGEILGEEAVVGESALGRDDDTLTFETEEVVEFEEDDGGDVLEFEEQEEKAEPARPAAPPPPPPRPRPRTPAPPPKSPGRPKPPKPPPPSVSPRAPAPPPPPPPAEPPAAAAAVEGPDISEELEEIDFFVSQGLVEEAQGILDDLLAEYPDDPRLAEVAQTIAAAGGTEEPPAEEPPSEEPADLESGLDLDDLAEGLDLDEITTDEMVNEIDEVFSQFKAGVQEQISKTDYATHYDLGIAYREMGLLDDAINEFTISKDDPARLVQSVTMIGLCLVTLGRVDDALELLRETLDSPALDEQGRLALIYEQGKIHEAQGNVEGALEMFNKVINSDPGFADVADRIEALS
jgi:tetratricopeptide (TPR) repeat protein